MFNIAIDSKMSGCGVVASIWRARGSHQPKPDRYVRAAIEAAY